MIDINDLTHTLERNARVIRELVDGITEPRATWRSSPGKWSLVEIVNHLYDEEREDFRQRIDLVLHRREEPWPPMDPAGWVVARNYQSRRLDESLKNFLDERKLSVEWLRNLEASDWDAEKPHPAGWPLSAGTLLVSWVAHDYLHIRQITRLLYEQWKENAQPYSVEYAGPLT